MLARSEGPNRVGVFPSLRTATDPVSKTLCSLLSRIPDNGRSLETPVILNIITTVF
jgi:hypothetical protein